MESLNIISDISDTKVAFISGSGDLELFDAVTGRRTSLVSRDVFVSIKW